MTDFKFYYASLQSLSHFKAYTDIDSMFEIYLLDISNDKHLK